MKSKLKKATTSSYGLVKKDSIHSSEQTFSWNTSLPGFFLCLQHRLLEYKTGAKNAVEDIYFVKLLFCRLMYIKHGNENIFEW